MNETKTIQILGYEWCKPVPTAVLRDYVCVGYDGGWLALCRVEQDVETGTVERVMMMSGDLNKADR